MDVIKAALLVIVVQLTVICWHLRFFRDEVKNLENAEIDRMTARKMVDAYTEAIAGASMLYKIGDKRVFYNRDYRDKKADDLERMGYCIARYDGISNFFLKVLGVPSGT